MAKKVLIIEDEKLLLKNLVRALEDEFVLATSITGHEGLRIAQQESLDLIVLDIVLPDIDGVDVLKKLKMNEHTKKIPVMVLTNLDSSDVISRIKEAGGKEYLSKTEWSLDDIVKKIRTLAK